MTRRTLLMGVAAALQEDRIDAAMAKVRAATAGGEVAAAALLVKQGSEVTNKGFGKARGPDEVFLLASITKPITVTAVMKLIERGKVSLSDPVNRYIPEFRGGDRGRVTVRMLLTHTSGLPDMLPDNEALRKRHAPLKDFVAGTCRVPLLFPPGTQVKYQSMGILLAAEIVERVSNMPLRDYLKKEVFSPLGMNATSLGMGGRPIAATARCQVPESSDWDWNSPYWRNLGAPWGGALSTTSDVARFLEFFLHPRDGILKASTAGSMIRNQTAGLDRPWGFGFMIEPGAFGKTCSPRTFGHYGSTGTVAWADPAKDLICVLLTTKPAAQSRAGLLGPVSDLVAAAA